MVHEDDVAQFVDAYSQAVAAFYPDGSTGTDYTSIINEKHYARLTGLLDDARAKGARVVSVGRDRENAPTRAHTLSPSVVLDTTDDMTIMREEIFGPILRSEEHTSELQSLMRISYAVFCLTKKPQHTT